MVHYDFLLLSLVAVSLSCTFYRDTVTYWSKIMLVRTHIGQTRRGT